MSETPQQMATPSQVRRRKVIEVRACRGAGVVGDPIRIVTQYWSYGGVLLAERDPQTDEHNG